MVEQHEQFRNLYRGLEQWSVEAWQYVQLRVLDAYEGRIDDKSSAECRRLVQELSDSTLAPAHSKLRRLLAPLINCPQPLDIALTWHVGDAITAIEQFLNLNFEVNTHTFEQRVAEEKGRAMVEMLVAFQTRATKCLEQSLQSAGMASAHFVGTIGSTYLADAERTARELRATAEGALAEARAVKTETQTLLSQAVFTHQSTAFFGVQKSFRFQAVGWLLGTLVFAAALLRVLTCFLLSPPSLPHSKLSWFVAGNLAHFAPRFALASALSMLVLVCVREYRAARHNQVVNLHRAGTVATLEALVRTGDARVNDQLRLLAAQTLFSPAATAFDGQPAATVASSAWPSLSIKSGDTEVDVKAGSS